MPAAQISTETGASPAASQAGRSNEDLIRDIVRSSRFEWTTLARLTKRTGLDREQVLEITRAMPDIKIGFGRQSQDNIFRLRRDDE